MNGPCVRLVSPTALAPVRCLRHLASSPAPLHAFKIREWLITQKRASKTCYRNLDSVETPLSLFSMALSGVLIASLVPRLEQVKCENHHQCAHSRLFIFTSILLYLEPLLSKAKRFYLSNVSNAKIHASLLQSWHGQGCHY